MGTVGKKIGAGHAGEKSIDLQGVQRITGFHRRLAGHGGQDVIEDRAFSLFFFSIAKPCQNIDKECPRIALTGHGGNSGDDKGSAAEFPDRKTHLSDLGCMVFHAFGLGNGKFDRSRKKQGLAGDVSLHELPFQILKEEAFMGGMLIHHQEAAVF